MNPACASFRDPDGRLIRWQNRVLRALNLSGEESLRRVLASSRTQSFIERGLIVSTRFLDPADAQEVLGAPDVSALLRDMKSPAVVEHAAAPFVNYPHEWAPEMLHAAGGLTIELARSFLPEGIGLKDATPANVMFWGPQPVFLDVLSFERRDPYDPTWLPYTQFVRTFLLPLLVNRRYQIPLDQIFITRRDGLEPGDVYPLLSPLERLRPRSLPLITFPVWFGKRAANSSTIYEPRRLKNAEQARFILSTLFRAQQQALNRLHPKTDLDSRWSGYMAGNNNYADAGFEAKRQFVRHSLSEIRPAAVLDLGCNTGVFSLLAAELGARVVAVDSDPVVIGMLWRVAQEKAVSVLPLVVNIAQPTPAVGWANAECRSFLERATGAFDVVLMLALIHHLLVTDRIPLREIFQTARRLTRRWLIVEYIGPSDSMFKRLTRGREHLHRDFSRGAFEQAAQSCFRIIRSEELAQADRRLYLLEAST